ncbi:hypothetical protein GGS26DRAFT_590748 [Hypomontagnella submonticulosa]|nr:hypothetical protein GGS26DRAFT_590748 [Hypomontagnella submonticulosa]
MSRSLKRQFSTHWQNSTADNNLTLHGFRRFKTTHLLNLRFLEAEIAELDHAVYQAGLRLDIPPSAQDRLKLKHSKRDEDVPEFDHVITGELVLKLRDMLQQYDDALIAFNKIMSMDTFSLLDDEKQASQRDDLTLEEKYETRLLRVDRGPRTRQDPLQRWFHQRLRSFRYWRLSKKLWGDPENHGTRIGKGEWSYQNTDLIANFLGRLAIMAITVIFLIIPLWLLSTEPGKGAQLAIITVSVVIFSGVVTSMLKASNLEMIIGVETYG